MGIAVAVGDIGGPYVKPEVPVPAMATVTAGSTKVLIKGSPVALTFPSRTATTLGPVLTSTLNTTKTLIEGSPVILGGSVTNLATGWLGGVMVAARTIGVLVN